MNTNDLKVVETKPMPAFATFEFPSYKFKPVLASHLGLFKINGILMNSFGEKAFSFYVNVDNEPPSFISII